ncbi:family 20 glycosylhydrolase [Thalassomonas sp. M1454]|uniref:family 20 glycosylhydrolase n=1 Tax=Thalassomonas sp. M1454 TaxID=2594477 RepID=UPI0011805E02|nr:family 20 glycosylhydrolase [Thalassomonas sp. M1454]TRX55671.1 family 20 glycosylhydrolase [Thalassomonas sp. M1454]
MNKKLFLSNACIAGMLMAGCSDINNSADSASTSSANSQEQVINFSNSLKVNYQLISNIADENCNAQRAEGNCFLVELSFTPEQDFTSSDWAIYYSQINPVQSDASDEFDISHVNGDLHKITPTENFKGFVAGQTYTLPYRVDFWTLSETDALPNYIFKADGAPAQVITSTQTVINEETGLEEYPFVSDFSSVEKHFKRTPSDQTKWATSEYLFERNSKNSAATNQLNSSLIPTPQSLKVIDAKQSVNLAQGINVEVNGIATGGLNAAFARLAKFGVKQNDNGIKLVITKSANISPLPGSYQLSIAPDLISIDAFDDAGAFYALQSISGLISLDDKALPTLEVIDAPHYQFRGLLVDVARNFHSKQFILDLMEQMAAYKLNKLHLHLGDDEGWRLEIKDLPELTELSSKRCFDLQEESCLLPQLGAGVDPTSKVNGYYSIEDYKQILQFASARHIQVIPSLDMPGHSRSSIVAMKARYNRLMAAGDEIGAKQYLLHDENDKTVYSSVQYYNDNTINACMESSYDFVAKVMDEVKAMHVDAGQPLTRYHIGADETAGAWVESPVCKEFLANNDQGITKAEQLGSYFIERVAKILSDRNIETAGWNDGMMHTNADNMPKVVQANSWGVLSWEGHKAAHELANRNWEVVVSTPDVTYFDFPYEADPKEHGYYWAIRHSNTEKLFQFMPDNLPVHAEIWLDREDKPFIADDSVKISEDGVIESGPLATGNKFVGIQGQLWSENTRNDNLAEYKIFPRLFSLAERAWHKADWSVDYKYSGDIYNQESNNFTKDMRTARDQQWANFANVISNKELAKLDKAEIFYRIPTVGAKVIAGELHINNSFTGLPLEYRVAQGEWQQWTKPVKVNGEVEVRARSIDLKRAGRSLFLNK